MFDRGVMKNNSKISVIMAVYNTEKFVWEAIESILKQDFENFEFIIIDDFSNDWSYEICQEYAKKDLRIKLHRNDSNKWISFTRNRLISLAEANFIATQDSDDVSELNRLRIEYDFLIDNSDYWVVSWNNIIIDEEGIVIWLRKYWDNIKWTILKKNPISQPSSMFRKDVYFQVWWYDKDLNYWEDYDLWLKIYSAWFKIKNLNIALIKYRIRKWQTKSKKLKETLKNTILIQKKAVSEYWIDENFSDLLYRFLEQILLILPNSFIIYLFKKLEYKRWKI